MYGHNEKCPCVFCTEWRLGRGTLLPPANGTDQRLDRVVILLGQLVDQGIEGNRRLEQIEAGVDVIADAVPEPPGLSQLISAVADLPSAPEPVQIREPARGKKK